MHIVHNIMNASNDKMCCPCGSDESLEGCCGKYISEISHPDTAEELMRSRYTAYVLCNEAYLLSTWYVDNRPVHIAFDPQTKWLDLRIKNIRNGGLCDDIGEVEFIARCKIGGRAQRLHERSQFRRSNSQWQYVGEVAV